MTPTNRFDQQRHHLTDGDDWYIGTVELGFEAATYRFGWLPERLNPFRPKAVREARIALRFQRTPDQADIQTERMGPLWIEDLWPIVRNGLAEAVFAVSFRVAGTSEQAVAQYLKRAFAPVPDRVEVTDIERTYPAHSGSDEDTRSVGEKQSTTRKRHMRETGHPEYSEFAEAMRRVEGVSSVNWAYDDLYEIVFDPNAFSGTVVHVLKLATEHGYRPIEVESFHVDQNKIHVEGTHPPTTISIE